MPSHRPYLDLIGGNRDFRRLWLSQLISLGGDWFNSVALLGLTLELTHSPFMATAAMAASLLPGFLFAPIAGVMADRLNRKMLMIVSDAARIFLALGMLLVTDPQTVWIGIACMAGIATFGAFFTPASQAALPNLVSPAHLGAANVLASASWGTMLIVGAALGGLVASAFGRDTAFVVNAASFALSGLFVLGVKGRFSEDRSTDRPHPFHDLIEGLGYARGHPDVLSLLMSKGGYGLGAGVLGLLAVFATEVFHRGDSGIGILFAARGLGALVGPIVARRHAGDEHSRRLFMTIGVSMGLFGVGYAGFAAMPSIWLAAVMAFVAHLGGGAQWVLSSYGLQKLSPDWVRGRIMSFDFGLATLSISAGLIVAGRAAEHFSPRYVMAAFSLFDIVYAALWTIWASRMWNRSDLAAAKAHPSNEHPSPEAPDMD